MLVNQKYDSQIISHLLCTTQDKSKGICLNGSASFHYLNPFKSLLLQQVIIGLFKIFTGWASSISICFLK